MTISVLGKNTAIQYLRAIAALTVVFYHASGIFRSNGDPFFIDFHEGRAGVDLFFVLSGYVIMNAHAKDIGVPRKINDYIIKRVWRIFPLAILATGFTLALVIASGQATHKLDPLNIFASFLLLPQDNFPVLNVTWTLVFEMFFYAIFATWILSIRLGVAVTVFWLVVAIPFSLGFIDFDNALAVYLQPIIFEFGLGVAVYLALQRFSGRLAYAATIAGAGLFIAALAARTYFDIYPHQPRGAAWSEYGLANVWGDFFSYGIPSALLVYGVAAGNWSSDRLRFLKRLGDASFAIYLIHRPVLLIIDRLIHNRIANDTLAAIIAISISVAAGYFLHYAVDERIQRRRPLAIKKVQKQA